MAQPNRSQISRDPDSAEARGELADAARDLVLDLLADLDLCAGQLTEVEAQRVLQALVEAFDKQVAGGAPFSTGREESLLAEITRRRHRRVLNR